MSIKTAIENLEKSRIAIINALQSKGVKISNDATLMQCAAIISTISINNDTNKITNISDIENNNK